MSDLQRQVQEAADELVESGAERGLQAAVYRHGELVVDAVAGAADPATGRRVTTDTPFYSYAVIADAEPWWEPGTKTGYHAYTFGYIVGEVVRRATGKPISQVLREEVAGPLGIADELFFGMPESELGRLARLEDAPGAAEMLASIPDGHPMFRTGPRAVWPTAEFGNRPDVLMADIPAGCKNTARAVARMYAALLGEVDGVRPISPERLREVTAVATADVDQIKRRVRLHQEPPRRRLQRRRAPRRHRHEGRRGGLGRLGQTRPNRTAPRPACCLRCP